MLHDARDTVKVTVVLNARTRVLGLFWLLGTAALVAARQPRAAGVFLVVCLIVGGAGAAILLGTTADMGLSAIEAALILDSVMIYAAWRLLLRPSANAPQL